MGLRGVGRGGDFRVAWSAPRRATGGSAVAICGKQFNERTGGALNRAQYPSDVIALAVVLGDCGYKLSLRDLPEMFLLRGIEFTYEAVRDLGGETNAVADRQSPPPPGWWESGPALSTSMKPTSKSVADGAICIERLTALALWWM